MVKALDRKLLRDLWLLRGQFLTIAAVVAVGIAIFVASFSTYVSLEATRRSYYLESRLADIFAFVKRAPESAVLRVQEQPAIAEVESRLVYDVSMDVADFQEPVTARMISIPEFEDPKMNKIRLKTGRMPVAARVPEVLVNDPFAKEHHLTVNSTLSAIMNDRKQTLRVVGVAYSPEYIFAVQGNGIPDNRRFGVFWIRRPALEAAFDMKGAFNSLLIKTIPGTSVEVTLKAVDSLLSKYGGVGATLRKEQASPRLIEDELGQLRIQATYIPAIFLAVTAFLLNIVLSRLIETQRGQIAALKALGYNNFEVMLHYLKMASFVFLVGAVLGFSLGYYLGNWLTIYYGTFFKFPTFAFHVEAWIPALAVAVSILSGLVGGFSSVWRASHLAPAEAMRPAAPPSFSRSALDDFFMGRASSVQTRMTFRNLLHRPLRTALATLGIAAAVGVVVLGTFWFDSINYLLRTQFFVLQHRDAQLSFVNPVGRDALHELRQRSGILFAEGSRAVPVNLRFQNHNYKTAIMGVDEKTVMKSFQNERLQSLKLEPESFALSSFLRKKLRVKEGDRVEVQVLEGHRKTVDLVVTDFVIDYVGVFGYMPAKRLSKLLGEGELYSMASLQMDSSQMKDAFSKMKQLPNVGGVSSRRSILDMFNETVSQTIIVFSTILTGFAVVIALGVLYNGSRIALAERARELASLRVLGFRSLEVGRILFSEQVVEILFALPLGSYLGKKFAEFIMKNAHSESVTFAPVIEARTHLLSWFVIFCSALLSTAIVYRNVRRLDMVGVLKTQE